jgi:hypothetical protein
MAISLNSTYRIRGLSRACVTLKSPAAMGRQRIGAYTEDMILNCPGFHVCFQKGADSTTIHLSIVSLEFTSIIQDMPTY